jgi:hypothetical protein
MSNEYPRSNWLGWGDLEYGWFRRAATGGEPRWRGFFDILKWLLVEGGLLFVCARSLRGACVLMRSEGLAEGVAFDYPTIKGACARPQWESRLIKVHQGSSSAECGVRSAEFGEAEVAEAGGVFGGSRLIKADQG